MRNENLPSLDEELRHVTTKRPAPAVDPAEIPELQEEFTAFITATDKPDRVMRDLVLNLLRDRIANRKRKEPPAA